MDCVLNIQGRQTQQQRIFVCKSGVALKEGRVSGDDLCDLMGASDLLNSKLRSKAISVAPVQKRQNK